MRDVLTPLQGPDPAHPGHLDPVDEPARYARGSTVHVVYAFGADGPGMTMTVDGHLDGVGAPALQAAWVGAVDGFRGNVRLDLQSVDYANSAGLHVLEGIRTACRERGWQLEISSTGLLNRLLHLPGMSAAPGEPNSPVLPGGRAGSHTGASGGDPGEDFAAELADWGRQTARGDLPTTVAAVLEATRRFLPAADSATLHLTGEARVNGATIGPLAADLALLGDRLRQGPGWDSARDAADVHTDDLHDTPAHDRWPELAAAASAAALPVRSVLSLHLDVPGQTLGVLTVSSAAPRAFDASSRSRGHTVGAAVSTALAGERDRRQLQQAIGNRDVIGQAKGIVMERHGLTADAAFLLLKQLSSTSNTKLHLVAESVVRTGLVVAADVTSERRVLDT